MILGQPRNHYFQFPFCFPWYCLEFKSALDPKPVLRLLLPKTQVPAYWVLGPYRDLNPKPYTYIPISPSKPKYQIIGYLDTSGLATI